MAARLAAGEMALVDRRYMAEQVAADRPMQQAARRNLAALAVLALLVAWLQQGPLQEAVVAALRRGRLVALAHAGNCGFGGLRDASTCN